jgi:predicted TPR repeat methyltransferase
LLPDPIADAESLIAEGRARDAADALQALLAQGRGGLLLRVTLVKALIAAGDIASALDLARETAITNPQAAVAAACLGEASLAAGALAMAIGEFQRALRLDSNLTQARFLLGSAWLAAGEADKALEAFETIAEDDAPKQLADSIAEARAMRGRPRSDPRYVRHLFDEFSADYDTRMLGQLGYSAPSILKQLADMLGIVEQGKYAILDLGCGTGLAGEAFKELAARLDGVDLSPAMIEKARARGIYDALAVSDLETALSSPMHGGGRQHPRRRGHGEAVNDGGGSLCPVYDLIIAADTLVYLGDLRCVFAGAANRLSTGGYFLFTVEKSDRADFELGPKRRWRHSEDYLRNEASRAGLDIAGLLACHPRSEAGVPVDGLAVALQRTGERASRM